MGELSHQEELRYNRQIVLPEFGFEGQLALKQARVLIIGVGGLGCSVAQSLAASGVGQLTLVDFDKVELSNLQRQILHREATLGQLKTLSARQALEQLNPWLKIKCIDNKLEGQELLAEVAQHSVVVDCTDNQQSREALNQACFTSRTPLVSGSAIRNEGQLITFCYGEDEPCYRCLSRLFGSVPESCVDRGVLAPVVSIIGSLQALAVIKLLSQVGSITAGQLQLFDGRQGGFREMKLARDPGCEVCSEKNR
ncbi:molybdopterin-synthase adenylyltransferase MoeB [Dongshaea marina]|uniref:molybdopterin-synthase adenylyltransferase MoeB n=1 Tax=Dongshaea marina TaxID=2047966 RepID=UPI000D3E897E|nr:molybdopterin-synthase adenylyltransferase MoeB [Dongshaea marina]